MGKARTLASTVSAGGPLEDGAIGISEVSGLQAALDAKTSLTSGTAVTTSSGTEHFITGIPASAKLVRLIFRNVSVTGSAGSAWLRVQLGTSSGAVASGYASTVTAISSTAASAGNDTFGFMVSFGMADADLYSGVIEFSEISANVWVASGVLKGTSTRMCFSAGDVSLGAELTQLRLSLGSASGFDGGTISVQYQ